MKKILCALLLTALLLSSAALAEKVHTTLPGSYLGGYPDDASTMAAYAQPLGAEWWATEGDAWKVGIDEAPTQRVVTFFEDMTGTAQDGVQTFPVKEH